MLSVNYGLVCQVSPLNSLMRARSLARDAEVRTHMSRATRCIFAFFVLHYCMWYKKGVSKSDFHSGTRSYSVESLCVIIVTQLIGDSHRDVIRFNKKRRKITATAIWYFDYLVQYIITQMYSLSLYLSVIQVKHQKIWLLSFDRVVVFIL